MAHLCGRRRAAAHRSPPTTTPSHTPTIPHPRLTFPLPTHPHITHHQVAFFIATNRLAALDAAVTRPGRFDLQLFVGTPNLPARMGRFRARLASALEASGGGAGGDGEVLAAAFEAVLQRRWVESARYMTFLETEKLAADSLALRFKGFWEGGPQAEQPELEEQIDQLLTAQAAVMTVRGTVRDDFDQNMNMSRK